METWKDYLRKSAAQAPDGSKLDNKKVEAAFADQAWVQIQNKVRPIAKEPYVLGFEIVWKNDSNSKMVGIYAFRINEKLFYSPVFFINGDIKGTDLFYREETKNFLPANSEWINYLIAQENDGGGKGIEKKEFNNASKQVDLKSISSMPITGRMNKGAAQKIFNNMCEAASELQKAASTQRPIYNFIMNEGMEGFNKLAAMICDNPDFANQLYKLIPETEWLPENIPTKPSVKSANQDVKEEIIFYGGSFNEKIPNEKRAAHISKGYSFVDTRKEASIAEIADAVEKTYSSITSAGVYDVILKGGLIKKLFVAPTTNNHCLLLDLETKHSRTQYINDHEIPWGAFDATATEELLSEPDTAVSENKAYCIYDMASGLITRPFYISDKKTYNGIVKLTGSQYSQADKDIIIIRDDCKTDLESRIFNSKSVIFFPVAFSIDSHNFLDVKELEYEIGKSSDITDSMFNSYGYDTSSLSFVPETETYVVKLANVSKEVTKIGAIGALMKYAQIREATALELINKANEHGNYAFFAKLAKLSLDAMNHDFFQTGTNDMGMPEAEASQYKVLDSDEKDNSNQYNNSTKPKNTNDNKNRDMLIKATPNELFELSERTGDTSIFEHGVVGSLVNTYDAADLIINYLKDLIQAVDKLGRSLFLFYWKPEDFAARYGNDDQSDMESMFLGNFKSLGDLVLELLKKNPDAEITVTTEN